MLACKGSDLLQVPFTTRAEIARKQQNLFGVPPRSFDEDALGFLIKFAKKAKGPFSAEQVTLAAAARGIAPRDLRAWGSIFTLAAKEGRIRRSQTAFPRAMGNGTLTLGWERT